MQTGTIMLKPHRNKGAKLCFKYLHGLLLAAEIQEGHFLVPWYETL